MLQSKQWINWVSVDVPGEKKPRKIPSNGVTPVTVIQSPDGKYHVDGGIDHLNPVNWVDYDTAAARGSVGIVLTENDPYFCVDIDNALTDTGWSSFAQQVCGMFPGAYVEVSQSGKGLHIIGQGRKPDGFGSKNSELGLEIYDSKRFIAITRQGEQGSADVDMQQQLSALVGTYMKRATEIDASQWTTVPRDDWAGPENDEELINKMVSTPPSAQSVWSNKASIYDLFTGNTSALIASYPDGNGGFDHSSADAALMAHLAFWTGCNHERMDRIFRRSALVRDKYIQRADYRARTVVGATQKCENVYNNGSKTVVPETPITQIDNIADAKGVMKEGYQFMSCDQQIDYFKGCVYISDLHRILTPIGEYLKPDQFKATYGGYMFSMDIANEKTTKSAWEAFTESRGVLFPKANGSVFRPELAPGTIFAHEGRRVVNSYVPIPIHREKGDVTPFLDFMNKLLPVERDRTILLSYMAACVQNIGSKFQWAPLIQGAQGNGKTFILSVMTYCLGERFSHVPNAEDLANKFNYWLTNRLFVGIEEVYVGDRREMIDALKPMITNKRIDIQQKGADQYTGDNRANFILLTNHKDGIKIARDDRRYAPFYTAQQSLDDIIRYGMNGDYFPKLYGWLENGGNAYIYDYLITYEIPDMFNPATLCHRAPETSSTSDAIKESLGPVEQEVMEAIEENRQGFRNGWISSIKLDEMLKDAGKARMVPRNKRGALLEGLGYFKVGRITVDVASEGRPIVYARKDIVSTPETMVSDYMTSQGYAF